MQELIQRLQQHVLQGFAELFGQSPDPKAIQLQKTRKEFTGDYTINVFPFLKLSRKSPPETAQMLGEYLQREMPEVTGFEVIKGFLNVSLSDVWWLSQLQAIEGNAQFGQFPSSGKTVLVEYSSPNTNKPLHLGHLRNIFLGDAVSSVLEANGHNVVRTQIINDRGIHICKSMLAWKRFGKGETPASSGIKGDHLVGKYYVRFDQAYKEEVRGLVEAGRSEEEAKNEAPILQEARAMLRAWEAGDPEVQELWKTMNGWVYEGFDLTYATMRVAFDKLYYESDTYLLGRDEVEKGLEAGVFYRKEDGSIWVDLESEGLDHKLLLRADGTAVYMTQDIGTALLRYRDYPGLGQLIYTVGNEQEYHFKVLFLILQKLGFEWAKECFHLSYGMVELPEGRMKSREGTVVDADDLMEEMTRAALEEGGQHGTFDDLDVEAQQVLAGQIGLAALKYFILRVDPKKKMVFNPEESIDLNGNTGPFIQYTYARIRSLERKAEELGASAVAYAEVKLDPRERELIRWLADFPQAVQEAGTQYSPAILANYTYDLVKLYNSFYQSLSIFQAESETMRDFRLVLSSVTARVIRTAMETLGMQVPERM
ncbi:MAG: arginine--tRNA ligase [Leptolyngbya sp. SIO3F4]|nr:arginine--tRNA ligase [Leptolyngbya sp. SIO3F4]